jgi:hypothetical protein
MSTQNVVPSSPAAPPAPVAAPATPVTAPVSQPSQPSSAAELFKANLSPAGLARYETEQAEKAKADAAAATPEKPVEAVPAVPADQPAAVTEPAQQEGEKPVVAAQAPPEVDPTKAHDGLDLGELVTAQQLNDKIKASPELKAALEKDKDLQEAMFRTARIAEEGTKFKEIFPDVETAQEAAIRSTRYTGLNSAFELATTPEGVDNFISNWKEEAVITDDDGKPIDAQGRPTNDPAQYQYHPAYQNTLNTIFERILGNNLKHGQQTGQYHPAIQRELDAYFESKLNSLQSAAEKSGDTDILDNLAVIRERLAPSSPAVGELPPDVKARLNEANAKIAEADKRESARTTADQQRAKEEREAFNSAAGEEAYSKTDELIAPMLANVNTLTEFTRTAAREKIDEALARSLQSDRIYQSRLRELHRLPPGPEAKQKIIQLMLSHANQKLGPIVKAVLAEATKPVLAAAKDKEEKRAAQVEATRSEPRNVTGPAAPVAKADDKVLYAAVKKEWADAHGGEMPDAYQLMRLYGEARRAGR